LSGRDHSSIDPLPLKWSDSEYGFWPEDDQGWDGRDTNPKRLSPSCARLMCWRASRMLNVIDEFTHECLTIASIASSTAPVSSMFCRICSSCAACRHTSGRTMDQSSLPNRRGRCQHCLHRSRKPLGERLCGSFNARLRDELLDGEIFYTLKEAKIVIESWRRHYNARRPHASLGSNRRRRRCSSARSPRGRLRAFKPLRRPRSPWRQDRH
jgi:Integrase core domain